MTRYFILLDQEYFKSCLEPKTMPVKSPRSSETIYSRKLTDGTFLGHIHERDLRRFKRTEKFVMNGLSSALDVGCFLGDWLHFIKNRKHLDSCMGIDISEDRVAEAQHRFPDIHFRAGKIEAMSLDPKTFDLVTCLEVLEHIENWEDIFQALFRFARKQVIISVPNNEKIEYQVCIHCCKPTPMWGHLHSFNEHDFPEMDGWRKNVHFLKETGPFTTLAHKIYYMIRRKYPYLIISYEKL